MIKFWCSVDTTKINEGHSGCWSVHWSAMIRNMILSVQLCRSRGTRQREGFSNISTMKLVRICVQLEGSWGPLFSWRFVSSIFHDFSILDIHSAKQHTVTQSVLPFEMSCALSGSPVCLYCSLAGYLITLGWSFPYEALPRRTLNYHYFCDLGNATDFQPSPQRLRLVGPHAVLRWLRCWDHWPCALAGGLHVPFGPSAELVGSRYVDDVKC